jgi:hypothetical protein
VLALSEAGGAAVTQYNPYGTTLLDGTKVFPIVLAKGPERGSLTPDDTDALDEVVGAGVNFFKVGPATRAWNDEDLADALAWSAEASARGAYTWVNLATLSNAQPGEPRAARLKQVVAALTSDANADAIGMWKGADEPWWTKTPAELLRYVYCLSTSRGQTEWCAGDPPVDSDHLWVTIQAPRGEPTDLAPYSVVTDIHGVDHYPVTWVDRLDPDLNEVGQWTNTIASITPNHAVWTTLQVCASGSDNEQGEFVLPTRLQERYMIYDAILNGARSLAFYGGNIFRCWTEQDTELQWNWTFWNSVLRDLIQEISAVSPLAPALVNPETTQVLPSSDPSTQVISRRGATSQDLWVIAARSGAGSQPVTISGLPAGVGTGTVYTEGRAVTVANGSFTDTFERWGVHVYHFRDEPLPPPVPPAPPPAPPPAAPPPPPAPPPAAQAPRVASRLLSTRLQTIPVVARAGRVFTVRVRVTTDLGTPVRSGTIRCAARAGKTSLRPIAKRWKRGYATCTWRLPKTARGKRLVASVRVVKSGLTLTRRVSRRIS